MDSTNWKKICKYEEILANIRQQLKEMESKASPLLQQWNDLSFQQIVQSLEKARGTNKEATIFRLILRWVRDELDTRESYLPKLLELVDLFEVYKADKSLVDFEFEEDTLCSENVVCLKMYTKLLKDLVESQRKTKVGPKRKNGNDASTVSKSQPANGESISGSLRHIKSTNKKNGIDPAPSSGVSDSSSIRSFDSLPQIRTSPRLSPLKKPRFSNSSIRVTRQRILNAQPELCLIYPHQKAKARYLYSYNWERKTCSRMYKFEIPRVYSCSIALGNNIYDIGGTETKFSPEFGDESSGSQFIEVFGILGDRVRHRGPPLLETGGCFGNQALNHCEVLDLSGTSEWEPLPAFLNIPRGAHSMNVIQNKLFVIGGIGTKTLDSIEMYQLETEGIHEPDWEILAPMKCPRGRLNTVVLDDIIYAIGGEDKNETPLKSVEYYDPSVNEWMPVASMRYTRREAGVFVKDRLIYVVGGDAKDTTTIEIFDPRIGKWKLATWPKGLHVDGIFSNAVFMAM